MEVIMYPLSVRLALFPYQSCNRHRSLDIRGISEILLYRRPRGQLVGLRNTRRIFPCNANLSPYMQSHQPNTIKQLETRSKTPTLNNLYNVNRKHIFTVKRLGTCRTSPLTSVNQPLKVSNANVGDGTSRHVLQNTWPQRVMAVSFHRSLQTLHRAIR